MFFTGILFSGHSCVVMPCSVPNTQYLFSGSLEFSPDSYRGLESNSIYRRSDFYINPLPVVGISIALYHLCLIKKKDYALDYTIITNSTCCFQLVRLSAKEGIHPQRRPYFRHCLPHDIRASP